jgi:hypothetical protein
MLAKRINFFDSGIILAAATAFLYSASATFIGAYLGYFALDWDVLDRNFQQILFHGFAISFAPALSLLCWYLFIRIIYSHGILSIVIDELRKSWKRKRQYLRIRRWLKGKRKDSKIELREKQHTVTVALFAALFLVFILSLMYFHSKGNEAAKLVWSKIENKTTPEHEMITVLINNQSLKLVYLMCGARNCAGVAPDTKVVYYFPQNGHSYILPPSLDKLPPPTNK